LNPLALYFLFVNCLVLPFLAIRGFQRLSKGPKIEISRKQIYIRTSISLLILAGFALFVAQEIGMTLFRPWEASAAEIVLGLFLLFGWFGVREFLLPWLRAGSPPNSLLRMPESWRQFALWSGVSLIAGVGEEIIYRGVLFNCLYWWTDKPIAAALVASVVFGIVHLTQGIRSAAFITVLALTFHGLVWIAGSLYMAMLAHVTFDLAVGLRYVLATKRLDAARSRNSG
jgi:membrane protease YdiL (CAAX protease family)